MDYSKYKVKTKTERFDRLATLPQKRTVDMVYTPKNVAEDMLDLLPCEIWNNPEITFLDIFCKSGVFLDRIYWRLYTGLAKVKGYENERDRSDHILTKQLFGIAPYEIDALVSRSVVYGAEKANSRNAYTRQFKDAAGNIKVFEKTENGYTNSFKEILNNSNGLTGTVMSILKGAFGKMKFDVVVGNPPYNKGMDLDFVNIGFELCEKYCVMITPAKWQTAAENYSGCTSKTIDYREFRKKLVPYMSYVCFYPDCSDVFNIGQIDGISYYILDKNTHSECIVENKSRLQKMINSRVTRSITNRESLLNIGDEIVKYLGIYEAFRFNRTATKGRYEYWINSLFSLGGGSPWNRVLFTVDGKCKILGAGYIVDSSKGEKCQAGVSQIIFKTDDMEECESFVSWLNCKFTRFFTLMNVSKLTCTYDNDYFRFVPAPPSGKFDHIYTDEELYKAFNLPQKYIDVIEAVIKERK